MSTGYESMLDLDQDAETRYEAVAAYKRPIRLVRGEGAVVFDDQGHRYIDCVGGIAVANVGHANPRVVAAITQQAARLISCPELFYNDVRAAYLERLVAALPAGMNRVFLCNSGTEAIEAAIKFARFATGRTQIIAAMRGFHGRTFGALSATWEKAYRAPFEPLVPDYQHVRYNDAAALEAAITERTAAVLLEVVQGEGGVRPATPEYLQAAARLCQERGALLMLDEVQTGFGRTGRMWACEHADITPDLLCLAKGIAGGIPMGATCLISKPSAGRTTLPPQANSAPDASISHADSPASYFAVPKLPAGLHSSTFGGNPLACAAAQATLDELIERRLPERAAVLGARLLERLQALAATSPLIREVRGLGLMLGIELREHVQPYLKALAGHGVLALTAGPYVIRLVPPLVIEEEQLEEVAAALEEVLR